MTPLGQIIRGVASITTLDREYPKTSTLHCSWGSNLCAYARGGVLAACQRSQCSWCPDACSAASAAGR